MKDNIKATSIRSSDYHDYVFKDCQHIGKYEEMYQNSKESPWHQDKVSELWHRKVALNFIEGAFSECGDIKKVLEIGCGYGYVLSHLKREGIEFYGCDVSPTAIQKAALRERECTFFVADLTHPKSKKLQEDTYDLVILYETLWYVVHEFDILRANLKKLTNPYLCVSLSFPKVEKDSYAKDILPNPQSLIDILEKDFNTLATLSLQKSKKSYPEDGINFCWLGSKK